MTPTTSPYVIPYDPYITPLSDPYMIPMVIEGRIVRFEGG